ncbi:MAG: bifunctional 4-hydroxy-2-oxoglutarate aldolase/2-dehydro-3-deoxy-phosphogluconate aldolase [Bacteroidota bacterium]|nr:bifunctional 4-hydroxy-2-oxoglutarate aldolase/2-dehydro-3-deoxy-phosphogluconate aldolase [Bacteroidota bacterium]MDP4204682.1 bifunctional 4-hydroxy-2-oxoglutarate aldolase/2-dehydro-3-deoxy-phosphogluconate aldolase [Bacteroidota bacterium]
MARFTRIEVALKMKETGIIPVFFHKDAELCKQVLKACYDGGIRVFEFTNRGDFAHEVFNVLIKWAAKELPELILGIGSIVDAPTAALYIQLGTNFVVSPLLNPEMAKVCNRRKIFWSPGCGSLSEIGMAEELGAEVCKIFPGSEVGGPSFVKSIKAPCPWSSIMPTGGVAPTEESLKAWFSAGVTCVGMGSQLISKSVIDNKSFDQLTQQCAEALSIVKKIRG